MIFAMSDMFWQALFAALLAGFIEWMRRSNAKKVDEVKAIAAKAVEKVDEVRDVAHKIHELTNGNMGEQLKIGMIAAQTLAGTTPTEANAQLSKAATEKYESHLASEALTKSA